MAIPSRVFVGMVIFGLIASLAIVPYTGLVLSGYEPEAPSPFLPPPGAFTFGDKAALVLASLFSIALTVFAWRGLLAGARHDAQVRRERAAKKPDEEPPGYN